MIINNVSGTNSLKANCQPDESKAIFPSIHEFISLYEKQPKDSINASDVDRTLIGCDDENASLEFGSDMELFDSIIFVDTEAEDLNVQSESDTAEFVETNVVHVQNQFEMISNDASRICQKFFKATKCSDCKENFDLMDRHAALSSVEQLLCCLNKTVADICSQELIKKTLLHSVQEVKVLVLGCLEHVDVIERKVKSLAVEHVLLSFCTNINKILSGKITTLPDKPSVVQKLAFEHRNKKRGIGKFSDQFN